MEYQRACPVCGTAFIPDRQNAVYCCGECRRRAIRDREQAKRRRRRNMTHDQKDNRLSVAEVYRRADGICSVCGLRVPLACDRNDAWSRTKDHIVPHRGDMRLFWDESNWQPLCKRHHDVKTRNEDHDKEYHY